MSTVDERERSAESTRESLAAQIHGRTLAAVDGAGEALFVFGASGADRTALLREVGARARAAGRGIFVAYGDAADPAHSAWRQIAMRMTQRHRVRGAARRLVPTVAGLIPVIGGFLNAIARTVTAIRGGAAPARGAVGSGTGVDEIRRLLEHGPRDPRLILLDNFEAADAPELSGAFALIRRLRETRTLLVVAAAGPARGSGAVHDLLAESERLGAGRALYFDDPGGDDLTQLLDSLSAAEREVLYAAASLGDRFGADALGNTLALTEIEVADRIAPLLRRGVIRLEAPDDSDAEASDVYGFAAGQAAQWTRLLTPAAGGDG